MNDPQKASASISRSRSAKDVGRLENIVTRLRGRYGLSRHGNYRDAFWELIFIIISVRTAENAYKSTFKQLRKRYPSSRDIAAARIRTIEKILQPAGLSKLKATQIRFAARSILTQFGHRGLTKSGRSNPEAVELYLRELPGVGAKVAKCVTMYACNAQSLPVDAHVWRVMSRLGYAPGGRLTERKALTLEAMIPARYRYAVHVLSISHGRAVCRPLPLCSECPVSSLCPSSTVH